MSVMNADDKLIRIGVVYDGNFFLHVSNYYLYHHTRGARISLDGLHAFVRSKVAELEGTEARYCPIIDAHYFRGRLPSKVVEERNRLLSERVFEDILIRQNITTHYLPIPEGRGSEKGIDVWLALETYELAALKRFNVIVLIAGDGDFVPLVRKLNSLGTRVMLLGWDFRYQDENGEDRETRTSQALQAECTYPVMMSSVIDGASPDDVRVNNLFVPAGLGPRVDRTSERPERVERTDRAERPAPAPRASSGDDIEDDTLYEGRVKRIKDGYGFIVAPQLEGDIFFYHLDVLDNGFSGLAEGDLVEFRLGRNEKGITAREIASKED